jgi:sulfate adenylyltransferase subunit 2
MLVSVVHVEMKKSTKSVFFLFDDFSQDENQRPELFDLLNGKIENGQNVRVFSY